MPVLRNLRNRVQRLLFYRVWERMLEIEFVDRSVALAGKAFVSFFPLVIVVAAFAPDRIRTSIITSLTARLGFRGDALTIAREAFASSEDTRQATGVLGLLMTIFFATSFTTALQRVYLRAWRRPPLRGAGKYWRGAAWLFATLSVLAVLGALRGWLGGSSEGVALFVAIAVPLTAAVWTFTPWLLLEGDVRARVLVPSGVITAVALGGYGLSATVWMPEVVTSNEAQFGMFGVALALVTWFSGASICVLVGACAGSVFAQDVGRVGSIIRGREGATLAPDASPALPPPNRALTLRDAFQTTDDAEDAPS
jgi:membrane protein